MAECIKQTEKSKMEGLLREGVHIDADTIKFIKMANDPIIRPSLLEHLQELELLCGFRAAETGTI